ncbi:hypothetical protein C8R43DRAFT_509581 [Mycena crocata]|nr:hypothetical protein C8R43DRAFT_509581 [Mycena crocata]
MTSFIDPAMMVLLFFATSLAVTGNLVLHDRRAAVPAGFVHSGAAPAEKTLNLRINLVQKDSAGLESALNAASFPDSPSGRPRRICPTYCRDHRSRDRNGVDSATLTPAGDWISFTVPVSKANQMLKAEFSVFTLAVRTRSFVHGCSSPGQLQW